MSWAMLIFYFGAILLQIYLSKSESRWTGLVLPCISLIIALLATFSVAAFVNITETASQLVDGEWVVVYQNTRTQGNLSGAIGTMIYVFILTNIPTAVLLGIYFAARSKLNRQREVEKMSVQDL